MLFKSLNLATVVLFLILCVIQCQISGNFSIHKIQGKNYLKLRYINMFIYLITYVYTHMYINTYKYTYR